MRIFFWRSGLLGDPRMWVIAAIAVLVIAWNAYVEFNDDGVVRGKVIDAGGLPVAGANVVMYAAGTVGSQPLRRVRTKQDGSFEFIGHGQHHFRLQATDVANRPGDSVDVRLYFRNQNLKIDLPLRLPEATEVQGSQDGFSR